MSRPNNFIIPVFVAIFNVLLVLFPGDIVEAARAGLLLWFNNVLPALLPFIIGTNILAAVGFVAFVGKLLDPVMMRLFRVPGAGGFALVTGMKSGYPMGAKTAALLVKNGDVGLSSGWRLAALSNNSGPLFVLGAVGAGLLSNVAAGYFILVCHYVGAIIVGLILARFAKKEQPVGASRQNGDATTPRPPGRRTVLFGEVIGTSVKNAMETIVVVGGYIILFAVIIRVLDILGIFEGIYVLARPVLDASGVDGAQLRGIVVGIIEMTNGAQRLSEVELTAQTVAALTFVVSFGGLSIHAQSASFLAQAGVRARGYMAGKLLHGLVSGGLAYVSFGLVYGAIYEAVPTYFAGDTPLMRAYGNSLGMFIGSIFGLFVVALVCRVFVRRRRRL